MALLDWQSNFYEPLRTLPRFQENYNQLMSILEDSRWKLRMGKRGIPFYSFLIHMVGYVERVSLVSQNVVWHCLPGYCQLIKALLCTMKLRPVVEYPDHLKEACMRLLANENLLNIFLHIILGKTNPYDSSSLIKSI